MTIRRYKLKAVFTELNQFDSFCGDDDFIEVVLWHNGEGIDVRLGGEGQHRFGLTWGQYKALRALIKELDG